MAAVFVPATTHDSEDRYSIFAPFFARCQFMLVEGDSQTRAPKIEVWRKETGTPPLATHDKSVLAVVTDDPLPIAAEVLPRSDIARLANWILRCVQGDLSS
jgi:molybdopterin-guanine dinucleotide biosynthesis protein